MSQTPENTQSRAKPQSFQEIILRVAELLGLQRLRDVAALRHGSRGRDVPPRNHAASLGTQPWAAAYVQPSRRPTDGRYGENPNRLQHYYQYQVLIKPSPPNLQELYLGRLRPSAWTWICTTSALLRMTGKARHWALGVLAGKSGVTVWKSVQFTYFQQVGGHDCHPVSGELTYGSGTSGDVYPWCDHVMDMPFNDPTRRSR